MGKQLVVKDFQTTIGNRNTDLYFLENTQGVRAAISNYGARLVALWMPDRDGELDNVVAGYPRIHDYLSKDEMYLGATVGRFANRIAGASFPLDGSRVELSANEGRNHLHGGPGGLHQKVWTAQQRQPNLLELYCELEDGQDGYPGNLQMEVSYSLDQQDGLIIEYSALSDKDTVLNVTNHTYFNLGGENRKIAARDHRIQISADHYLPVDDELLPTGKIAEVTGSPFDFRSMRSINEQLDEDHPQLALGDGYDHHFVLKPEGREGEFMKAARVYEPTSGRSMEVFTTEPGMQFFECRFSESHGLNFGSAFCLETQHFPDAPNRPEFPSTLLKAGERFHSKTSYRFDLADE